MIKVNFIAVSEGRLIRECITSLNILINIFISCIYSLIGTLHLLMLLVLIRFSSIKHQTYFVFDPNNIRSSYAYVPHYKKKCTTMKKYHLILFQVLTMTSLLSPTFKWVSHFVSLPPKILLIPSKYWTWFADTSKKQTPTPIEEF